MFKFLFELFIVGFGGVLVVGDMNRSFRAQESQMQAVMKQRQQLRASMRKEKEEELALFLEMKKREKERNDLLLNTSEEFDAPLGTFEFLIFLDFGVKCRISNLVLELVLYWCYTWLELFWKCGLNSVVVSTFAGAKPGTSPIFNISSSTPAPPTRKSGTDEFLNSENDKNDYDW